MILCRSAWILLGGLSLAVSFAAYAEDAAPRDVIADVRTRIKQDRASGADYMRLGNAYLSIGEANRARKAFVHAVRAGEKARGYTGIGRAYAQIPGRGLKAIYYFRRALGEDPNAAEAQYHLALLYKRLRPLDALPGFERAIEMDAKHSDAYYQLGLLLEENGDLNEALSAYHRQLEVYPSHGEARYRVGKLLYARGQRKEAAAIFGALMSFGGEVGTKAYLEMAVMSQTARNYDVAQRLFEAYIARLPEREQRVFRDISLVANADELARFHNAPDSLKDDVITRFWNSRDPAPLTAANERLVEHYRRVAYALAKYSKGEFPWDDRGEVYVRLGHPDHVSRSDDIQIEIDPYIVLARERFASRLGPGYGPPGGHPMFPVRGRWEYWVYAEIDGGTEFTFENAFGDGRYSYADLPRSALAGRGFSAWINLQSELVMHSIALKTPSRYRADFADLPIDFHYYPASFRGKDGKTCLELYLGLPASEVARLTTEDQSELMVLERGVAMYDSLWHEVHRVHDRVAFRVPTDLQVQAGAFIPGVMPVDLDPGKYTLSLQVRDVVSGKSQVYRQAIVLDEYARDETLKISDIELAFAIAPSKETHPFVKNGLRVVPMSSKAFRRDQNAFVYFEIYNLTRDEFGQTKYRVEYTLRSYRERTVPARILVGLGRLLRLVEKDQQVEIAYDQTGQKANETAFVELGLRETQPGGQLVRVRVVDLLADCSVEKEIQFKIVP